MMRLRADAAEIQGLAASQAQRQQPATGIAAQWSARHAGMMSSPLGPIAQANPMPGGLAASVASPAPLIPQGQRAQVQNDVQQQNIDSEASGEAQAAGAARGALAGAGTGAAIGTAVPVIGNLVGAAGGAAIGGLGGWLQARG